MSTPPSQYVASPTPAPRSSPRSVLFTLLLIATMVNPAKGVNWVLGQAMSLALARMDPIVNPNAISGHAHNIIGGSRFGKSINSHGDQLASKCSSVNVQADKSNYWAPHLYYRYADNTFAPMQGSSRIYYFNTNDDVVPFPDGLQMISGLAMTRDSAAAQSFGLRISCNHGEQTSFLPNKTSNPGGCGVITLGIFFPSCGLANGATTSPDHFSHMAWPHHFKGSEPWPHPTGAHCPDSHPIHYPAIFLEQNYWFDDKQTWRNDDNLLVLSTGDTTGLGFHADFANGWDRDVLSAAIKQCVVGDRVGDCPPFAPTAGDEKAWDCRLEGDIPAEDVGLYKALPKLPGCNPLWTADMPNTKLACTKPVDTPGYVAPNSYFRSDWQKMNIPLALPNATADLLVDTYPPNTFKGMTPVVGPQGSAWIKSWGTSTEGGEGYVKVSSVTDILRAFVNDNGVKVDKVASEAPPASSSASSAAASISSSAATVSSSSATTAAASTPTSSSSAAAAASPPSSSAASSSAAAAASSSTSSANAPGATGTAGATSGLLETDELGNPIGNVHLAGNGVSQSQSASSIVASASASTTASGVKAAFVVAETPAAAAKQKMCRAKKRGLIARQKADKQMTRLQEHMKRRSRRALLN